MRFINHIDEALHRSECIRTDSTPVISLRRLREYIDRYHIGESELQSFIKKYKSYSEEEIKDMCDKLYRSTPEDQKSSYFVRLR